eukprot:TRINITY_DN1461_c0_g1_i3.p1 TRINITY_DN1461_c0_g1~~TRINITY_DN1461_c0_g1_i3.p1  ORF type:complete len:273 (+),score=50.34 TRINITY_DN1461_c0_g1_i3:89-907(+)
MQGLQQTGLCPVGSSGINAEYGGWGGPNPPAERLNQLYNLVNMLGGLGIQSLVTLFDWETTFPAAGTQTESDHFSYINAIVPHFWNNPNVLGWDLKNEPDHPNNINGYDNWNNDPTDRDKIVSWLSRMAAQVKVCDSVHPVTVGMRWWENTPQVIPFEDIVSFHSYWPNIDQEITDIQSYIGTSGKSILLEEFGWPSDPYCSQYNEQAQLDFYKQQMEGVQRHPIMGVIQWMTFDATKYTNDTTHTYEDFFGLWRYDYSLKPAGTYYASVYW